jgi:DnaJ-class molecular chaperone
MNPFPTRAEHEQETDCETCDGFGRIWNNADSTSGQWVACGSCGDTRGHP